MSLRAELGVRTVVPFDHQRCQAFLRSPHMIGHDRDGVVEPHDLTHALDGLGLRIIDALHATAEDRRLRERRDLHARRPRVDAIDGRSVDLRRRVQALRRGADELEIRRSLERHAFGHRHAGRVGGKLAVFGTSARRRVKHFASLRATRRRIDIPALRRRRHEHGSRGRPGLAQRLPRAAYRVRVAGCLHAEQGIGIELFVGRSMFQPHLFQVHLQLFGDQHRDGGVGALAHLDVGHDQRDLTVRIDTDECVRCKRLARDFFRSAGRVD